MWPNLRFPADLVTFTEEILNGKLHFLCGASQFQAWFEIEVSQLRSATPDVTYRNRVLQICSNECRIRARCIINKNDNVYKNKMKENNMLILQRQILKAQKSLNHDEYYYHIK